MIYTGYYGGVRNYPQELELVAISRGIPKGFKGIAKEPLFMPPWNLIEAVKTG